MAGGYTYRPNPSFQRQVASEADMRRHLQDVAEAVAAEGERRLPWPRILGGIRVSAETRMGSQGWEGEARFKGPGWALWEFGTINHPARPAIRPGAQVALARFGGRLGSN